MVKTFCRCFFEKSNNRKSQCLQGFSSVWKIKKRKPTACSQSTRATNCATPRYLILVVNTRKDHFVRCALPFRDSRNACAHTLICIHFFVPIYYTTKLPRCLQFFVKTCDFFFIYFYIRRRLSVSFQFTTVRAIFHKFPLTFSLIYVIL